MLGHQKVDTLTIIMLALVIASATALCAVVPELMPWAFVAAIGAIVIFYWTLKWEITVLAWIWVLSYGLLEWPEWRIIIPGFFNMTVPRFIFVGMLFAFALYFMFRKAPVRFDRGLFWAMIALMAYCAASATATGWLAKTPDVRTAPYFRFLASMVFPFTMFFLVYNATRSEKQIRWGLLILTAYGWYALYIGYLQYLAITVNPAARAFIWPVYINNPDPNIAIHFDRARGAFLAAGPQGLLLVALFYIDLFLIRRIHGPYRAALIIQAVLILPAIFFTGIRASFVAFGVCGIIWCLFAGRGRFGKLKLATALLVVIVGVVSFWARLTSQERLEGGVAQLGPARARLLLAKQTWTIFKRRPVTGVGFGHFVDVQQSLPRDPDIPFGMTGGVLVEHNLFLNMVAETGILGLAGIVLVFVLVYRQSQQLYRKLPETAMGDLSRDFVVLFWVIMANFLATSMFRNTQWGVFANGMFWVTAGLVVGYNRLLEPQPLDLPVVALDID